MRIGEGGRDMRERWDVEGFGLTRARAGANDEGAVAALTQVAHLLDDGVFLKARQAEKRAVAGVEETFHGRQVQGTDRQVGQRRAQVVERDIAPGVVAALQLHFKIADQAGRRVPILVREKKFHYKGCV